MTIDPNKVDEAVIGLLYLVSFESSGVTRAWKGHDWDALHRLHENGLISNPRGKTKSVVLTDEGRVKAKRACENNALLRPHSRVTPFAEGAQASRR